MSNLVVNARRVTRITMPRILSRRESGPRLTGEALQIRPAETDDMPSIMVRASIRSTAKYVLLQRKFVPPVVLQYLYS